MNDIKKHIKLIEAIESNLNETVSKNLLYHALKVEHAYSQLKENCIIGRTFQRYWPDGIRRKEDDPDYEKSWQLKGISTTRDFDYAKKWGSVVYIFNKDLLAQKYKIIPYSWNFHFDSGDHDIKSKFRHKREREEFVVFGILKKTFDELEKEWLEKMDNDDDFGINKIDYVIRHEKGKLDNLSKYLEGIMVDKGTIDIYQDYEPTLAMIQFIMDHPKFKGTYEK